MKPPYRLVPDRIPVDTVEALEELLAEAKRGQVIGLAFAAMYRKRQFIVNTTGEARRNPTFTIGMLSALQYRLGSEIFVESR